MAHLAPHRDPAESLAERQPYMRYKICVSGAAETELCSKNALELAREVGREIVRQKGVLITGATTGIPYWAAIGAKEEGGLSIGLSPAATELAHVRTYRLPTNYFDVIIYTGFDYSGRNLLLTRSSDAIISICGRMGSLNEFTIAFEDKKPIGVLVGSGGMADMLKEIVAKAHRGPGKIVYDPSPKELVAKVIRLIDAERTGIDG
ncbi:LOG family protein [Candidatus Parcubacteria bacterium]|nr:LOG family protein [Candidatus Parcubacteria bacterium]